MKIIAIDVMGNDNGIKPIVDAVLNFLKKNLDYKFILVGKRSEITLFTKETERIEIINVEKFVKPTDKAYSARDLTTSMAVAVDLVKTKRANAVLSSGSSATYLANTILILKRISGIKRPAFLTILPSLIKNKKTILLDCGANIEVSAENLVQWARLAKIFSEVNLKVKKPVIGILNVGTEDEKGLPFHIEANKILNKDTSLNYVGFIEPRYLLDGTVDIAIVDGYGGNLILKTMEGTALSLLKLLKENIKKNIFRKILALGLKNAFIETKDRLDYRNVGAAWILGINGIAIKAHGSSDKKAYLGALGQVAFAIENGFIEKISKDQ